MIRKVIAAFGLVVWAACSPGPGGGEPGPFADPWTVMPASEISPLRDYTVLRGIVHNHSPYSHDACDDSPFPGGVRDEQCLQELRDAMCQTAQDFVFLTDHADSFADHEYPDVLLWVEGDSLVLRGSLPAANRVACPDGRSVIVTAGTETGMMPVGLEHHLGERPAERRSWYERTDAVAIRAMQDAGALVFLQHTEGWPAASLQDLPIDGIECYNLHQNLKDNPAGALEMLLLMQTDPAAAPAAELILISFFQENQADLERWALALQTRPLPAVLATDGHRNSFPSPGPDGERLDSFRRLMHWFSNYLLVPAGEPLDDALLKETIGRGRMFGAFDYLGYPVGFDFRAERNGESFEMGDTASGPGVELILELPAVYRLDPVAAPPLISGRILRAGADGTWTVVARGTSALRVAVSPGAYRAEVRQVPHHLVTWLGNSPDRDIPGRFLRDTVWVYANPIYVE